MAKPSKKKDPYVQVCPQCKSPRVYRDASNPLEGAIGLPAVYVCEECGHSGNLFPEVRLSELEEFLEEEGKQEEIEKEPTKKVDTSYGDFITSVYWKFIGPPILVLGLLLIFRTLIFGITLIILGIIMTGVAFFKKQ